MTVSGIRAWPDDREIVQAQTAKDAALSYLRSLPLGGKIYVWPTWRRPYEILADDPNVTGSVERYKTIRGDLNGLFPAVRVAQISVIAADGANWRRDIASSLTKSQLLPSYKKFIAKAEIGSDGCTAYKSIDRDTWASVGIILVNELKFRDKNMDALDQCIHAALDYLQGFPTRDRYFEYLTLPDATVRGLVIKAIYKCAAEVDGTRDELERSRDGLALLPSLECVSAKINQ